MHLTVCENYLYKDKKPFFWLGDTAWLLFEKLSIEEAKLYLDNRKSLGFTVVQAVLVHTFDQTGFSCAGKTPKDIAYWNEVKEIIKYAKALDIVMGILPAWGGIIKNNIINMGNIDAYADFLIDYFSSYDNIVWILGGDIRGEDFFDLYDHFGDRLKRGMPNHLFSFHPFGRTGSYQWFSSCHWIDFHMFQSGHRRYDQTQMHTWDDKFQNDDQFGEDNYKYVFKNQSITDKPCLDGEPSYEGILQGLHDINQPYWEAKDIRRYAYWSVLAGACGFTYGNNAVMQFHTALEKGNYGVREVWTDAIHMPGGAQMQYLKNLMEEVHFSTGSSRQDLVAFPKPYYEYVSVFVTNTHILCYSFLGKSFTLNLKEYVGRMVRGFWMNPENDSKSYFGSFLIKEEMTFQAVSRHEASNDWVLILEFV